MVIAAISLLAGLITPVAFASPINPNLTWAPNPIAVGGTTTATFGVSTDADCPSGTYTGTLTVTDPASVSHSFTGNPVTAACGVTNNSAIFPNDFTGGANTRTCGTYTATWTGTTSANGGSFGTLNTFKVTCPVGAPEFGAPSLLVAAMGIALLAALRKTKFLKL